MEFGHHSLISSESRFHVTIQIKLIETFKLISKVFELSKGRQDRTLLWMERPHRAGPCGTSVYYAGWRLKRRGEEHSLFHLTINLSFLNFRKWSSVTNINFHFNCFLCFPASYLLPATIWKTKEIPSFVPATFTAQQHADLVLSKIVLRVQLLWRHCFLGIELTIQSELEQRYAWCEG